MTLRKEYKEHDYLINTYGSFAEARNDKFHVDERRYSSILKLTANGTLIMGIWSLIKCFMEMIGDMGSEILADEVPLLIAIFGSAVVIGFFFMIGISFRYLVWRGACKEAASGKSTNGYIACAIILLAYGVYAVAYFIYHAVRKEADVQGVLKLIFDVTSFIILCELIASAFRLRKVRKEIAARETGGEL